MQVISCPHCQKPLSNDDKIGGKEVECPHCSGRFQMPLFTACSPPPIIAPARVSAEPAAPKMPPSSLLGIRFRALSPYIQRCGIKSALFQGILTTWTCLALVLGLVMAVVSMPSEAEFRMAENGFARGEAAVTGWIVSGLVCPVVVWALIGLPLVIAAIATLKVK